MFKAYVVVAVLTAGANIFAAISDFTRPEWLRTSMAKVHVPDSWLTTLGSLKGAGAVGILVGIGMPVVGTVAAAGLTLFFVGAIVTHLRAHDHSFGQAIVFLLLAIATLALGLYAR